MLYQNFVNSRLYDIFSYKDLWVTVDFPTFFRVEKSTVVEGYVIFFRGFVRVQMYKVVKSEDKEIQFLIIWKNEVSSTNEENYL